MKLNDIYNCRKSYLEIFNLSFSGHFKRDSTCEKLYQVDEVEKKHNFPNSLIQFSDITYGFVCCFLFAMHCAALVSGVVHTDVRLQHNYCARCTLNLPGLRDRLCVVVHK